MRYFVIFTIAVLGFQDEKFDFTIKTRDGCIFHCKLASDFKLSTKKDKKELSLKDIKSIKAIKDGFEIRIKKDVMKDDLEQDEISITTNCGSQNIKVDDIDLILSGNIKSVINDEHVVGFWDFAGDEDVTLKKAEYATEDGNSVVKVDCSKGQSLEIPHKDDLNTKDITIEMRFKGTSLSSGQYTQLMNKTDPSGYSNYSIQLSKKGLHMWAYSENLQYCEAYSKKLVLKDNTWHYLALTVDTNDEKVSFYLDGKKVSTSKSGNLGGGLKSVEAPIKLFSGVSKSKFHIDFLRISKKVRSEDEIKEIAEMGGAFGTGTSTGDKIFNTVIVAKNGERYTCKLESDELNVETRMGDVKISSKHINKISLFEYRKEHVDAVHKKAKDLIKVIEEGDEEKTRQAENDLKKLGWLILPVLEENKYHSDNTVRSKIQKLVDDLGERKKQVMKDRLEGNGLLLSGWIKDDSLKGKTKHGDISVKTADVKQIQINQTVTKADGNATLELVDGSIISGKLSIETIAVKTDYGELTIPIKNIVRFVPGKEEDTIITGTSSIVGKIQTSEFELDSQIGKLKIKKSDLLRLSTELDNDSGKSSAEEPKSEIKEIEKEIRDLKNKIENWDGTEEGLEKIMIRLKMLEDKRQKLLYMEKENSKIDQLRKKFEKLE